MAANNTVKIGVVATLIGPCAVPGQEGLAGVDLVVDEFGGRVAGKKIEVVVQSSNAVPDSAVEAVQSLLDHENVDFVVGPVTGNEGLAVRDYAMTSVLSVSSRIPRFPLIPHIGGALLVARAIGEFNGDETALFIERSRVMVALESPQHQAVGTQLLRLLQKRVADTDPLMRRPNVQVLHPRALDGDEADHAFLDLGDQHRLIRDNEFAEEAHRVFERMENR